MTTPLSTIGLTHKPRMQNLYRLQWEEVQKAWVLLYPEGMVKLNTSAGEILQRLDGLQTVQDLIDELEQQFAAKNLAPDVLDFLAHAQRQGWVQA